MKRFLDDLGKIRVEKPITVQVSHDRAARLVRPPQGLMKINVDWDVAHDDSYCAVSSVYRDENGVFLGTSSRPINSVCYHATLEAMVCAEALIPA
jgi:hypothetical protein